MSGSDTCSDGDVGCDSARHASAGSQGVHSVPGSLQECDCARVGQNMDHEQKGAVQMYKYVYTHWTKDAVQMYRTNVITKP